MADQKWVAPSLSTLQSQDAGSLRNIFSSLSEFLAALDLTGGGATGPAGPAGSDATVGVHSTITTAAGTSANVINIGTSTNASLDFYIPRGDKGDRGDDGYAIYDLDGGGPTSVYGGIELIDAGGI